MSVGITEETEQVLDVLEGMVAQCLGTSDGLLDSMALTDYANALRCLAHFGRAEIVSEYGRRVIAKWPEGGGGE